MTRHFYFLKRQKSTLSTNLGLPQKETVPFFLAEPIMPDGAHHFRTKVLKLEGDTASRKHAAARQNWYQRLFEVEGGGGLAFTSTKGLQNHDNNPDVSRSTQTL